MNHFWVSMRIYPFIIHINEKLLYKIDKNLLYFQLHSLSWEKNSSVSEALKKSMKETKHPI